MALRTAADASPTTTRLITTVDTRDDTLPAEPEAPHGPDLGHHSGAGDAESPQAPAGRPRRRRRWLPVVLAVVAGLALLALVASVFIPLPYYLIEPGSVRATEPLVEVGEGGPSYPAEEGDIYFTTVSTRPARALTALLGWLDPDTQVVDEEVVLGDQTAEENRRVNLQMMESSVDVAAEVAWEHLGFDVESGTGAVVMGVAPDLPVVDALEPGDVILAVDGQPTDTSDDVVDRIQRRNPGDVVELEVQFDPSTLRAAGSDEHGDEDERGDDDSGDDDQGGDDEGGDDEGGADTTTTTIAAGGEDHPVRTETVELGARPDDPALPLLGVQLGTRDQVVELPYPVSIDTGRVGGPSAGLAFTLAVLDVLTPGELTGGRRVAVTGTIDGLGNVGPIGGIEQKAAAVREEGADVFLVPASEADQARRRAGDVEVVGVETLDDALRALDRLGGNALDLEPPDVDQPAAA